VDSRHQIERRKNGMSTALQLRRASQNDCAQLGAWNHALIREEGHRNPMTATALEQRMRTWIAAGEFTVQLIERAGSAVGYVCWRMDGPREILVRQFFIVPNARRQSCGREAVEILRSSVWPRQARVTLECLVTNSIGLAFWRACGFTDYTITLEQLPSDGDSRSS
jgi:ribosomal protein S18 acetylase RimI-like enzyme